MLGCQVAGDALKRRTEEQMELWDVGPQWVVSKSEEAGMVNGYEHPDAAGCRPLGGHGGRTAPRAAPRRPAPPWWW